MATAGCTARGALAVTIGIDEAGNLSPVIAQVGVGQRVWVEYRRRTKPPGVVETPIPLAGAGFFPENVVVTNHSARPTTSFLSPRCHHATVEGVATLFQATAPGTATIVYTTPCGACGVGSYFAKITVLA